MVPNIFKIYFQSPRRGKIYLSLQTFQNFKINSLSNLNLINTLNFSKIKSKSQFPQNYHFANVKNFNSVPKYQISHSVLQIFTIMQNFNLILAIQNYAKWSLIPNHTLPNDFNHAIPLKITQGIQIHQWFVQKPSQTS